MGDGGLKYVRERLVKRRDGATAVCRSAVRECFCSNAIQNLFILFFRLDLQIYFVTCVYVCVRGLLIFSIIIIIITYIYLNSFLSFSRRLMIQCMYMRVVYIIMVSCTCVT